MELSGCAFLFESHVGVGLTADKLFASSWSDLGTSSALVASQSDSTKYPRYTAVNAAFNRYPTLDWLIGDVATVPWLETGLMAAPIAAPPITWLAAVRCTDITANRQIVSNRFPQTNSQSACIVLSTGKVRLTGKTAPSFDSGAALAAGEVVVLAFVAKPTFAAIYKNGRPFAYGPLGSNILDGVRIGASGFTAAGSAPMVGSIAALGCWSRELQEGEVALASLLLMRRYGLAS